MKNGVMPGHDPSLIIGPPMAVTPVPTARPTATPIPLPAPVQEYLDELGKLSKILAANDLASYNAETANLTAANDVLFSYLTPIGQRASAAMPQLPGPAATDAISLASEYDAASDDIGLSYLALQLWAAAQDTNSLAIAASLVTDTIAAVTAAGQQAVLVQNDLKGVTVPGQIVIAGDGVPVGGATFGGTVNVNYSFTNVGDKALPAGSVTLLPNANLALLTEATVTLPALAPGGSFLAGWQFNVSGSTSPVDFGHYQIDSSVTGAQPISLDEIFVIAGVPAPTPTLATTSTPARSATPKPTPSPTGSVTPARSVTPKPTPTPSSAVSATPSGRPTPPPLGSTTADRVLGQHYLNTPFYSSNLIDGHSLNHPQRVAIDRRATANHIYVSDTYYNRVLGWRDAQHYHNGDPADLIIGQPDQFSIGALSIDQIDCANVSAASLCQPEGMAVDAAGNLYVVDTGDDRVLKYNTPFEKTAATGSGDVVADMIFGLSSFTISPVFDAILCNGGSILTPPTAATLCEPSDVTVDAKGDVFISDSGNCRILEYNTPAVNDPSANQVFGQSGFTTNTCDNGNRTISRGALGGPTSVALDTAADLYVTDAYNNRVLEYFKPLVPPGAGGVGDTTPDLVFGQPNFTTASCGSGLNALCFNTFGTTLPFSNIPPYAQPGTGGIGVDGSGNLYVADTENNRVVEYNAPLTSQPTADLVFGGTCEPAPAVTVMPPYPNVSPSTLCAPGGVALDAQNNLFVADTAEGLESTAGLEGNQGRVLEYFMPKAPAKLAAGSGDTVPDGVLGQIDLTKAGPNMVKASGLLLAEGHSGIAVDTGVLPNRIYVSDGNNRVLAWHDAQGFKNGDPADLVFGQPDFYSYLCNNGGVSAKSLCQPAGLAVDGAGNLYVGDYLNHRVLEYNTPFTKTGIAGSGDNVADMVFGQSGSFTTNSCGGGPDGLCSPTGVGIDPSNNVYIADRDNDRVLEYNTPLRVTGVSGSGDTTADLVFGQSDLYSNNCNQNSIPGSAPSASTLCKPTAVLSDSAGNVYIADAGNGRVLEYDKPLPAGATTAKRVFGHKGNFTEGVNGYECNNSFLSVPPTPDTLCYPSSLGLDNGGNLFVGDLNNNRVLEFNYPLAKTGKPGSGDTTADRVYGQNNSFTTSSCNSGGFTTDAGSLCNPLAVAVASNNTVFIADGANERVLAYDPLTTPTSTPSATASPFLTPIPTEKATATHRPSPAPTATSTRTPITSRTSTPTPTRTHTATPTPTPRECIASTPKPTVPVPTPTPLPGHPRIASVSSPVLAGASFTIKGSGFTKGSVVNFFVATPKGPVNEGPLSPDPKTLTGTQLVIPVPKTITLGEGFAAVVVINTDKAFVGSNPAFALLQGSTAAGLPSITELNGHPLASTSLDPDYAVDNVETTLLQGSKVVINGNGFDTVHGAADDASGLHRRQAADDASCHSRQP